ncbi:Cellulose synthase-like protein [Rhynchospora pubera]|uniref:Cellulose synthase-like protein n=1 Tax=Rhynchospora pubera TaxID=906938 RepID=A0AAV8HCT2_9POAL|nr:Cellulose synthase-like protein [Rhynchospora pubera]
MEYTKPSDPTKLNPPLNTAHVDRRVPINRVHMIMYTIAILAAIYHRITSILASSTFVEASVLWSLLVSDIILAFMWACVQAIRWRPVHRQEFLERLPDRVTWPSLDVFVCTADPHKEPPVGVVSTALSALAFDYPAEKLSVYVSDDGGADVTLFAFMEGAKFARHWLPFCRQNGIKDRSPEAFFSSGRCCGGGDEDKLKMMYESMKTRVESALEKGSVSAVLASSETQEDEHIFEQWKDFSRNNHPSVIQVLLESSKDKDVAGHVMPNLIYVSREKRPKSPHHFKAGALNTMVRVSSVLTNAPIILTIDCDMYSTDPTSPHRALCYFLDPAISSDLAYVQFPQRFQGLNKNDIYGGEIKRLFTINSHGFDGICGPNYVGSNTFHARRALFGSSLQCVNANGQDQIGSKIVLEKATEVANCDYEAGTKWGDTIGFRYGSLVEDYYTGYRLHCEGWKSVFCNPPESAFLGEAPKSLNDVLSQCKRWTVGLYEVGISKYSTITFGVRKASLAAGLCYSHYAFWGFWSIPVAAYAVLPQLALINNKPLFPQPSDPWFYVYAYLFLAAYIQDMADFISYKGTFRCWWSDQRMWLIRGLTAGPFGTMQFVFKQLNISTQGFNVTSKVMDDEQSKRYDQGLFDFGVDSPFFVTLSIAAILSLCGFAVGIIRNGMVAEMFLVAFGVANCWPIYGAIFLRTDGGKMPDRVTARAFVMAALILAIGCVGFNV